MGVLEQRLLFSSTHKKNVATVKMRPIATKKTLSQCASDTNDAFSCNATMHNIEKIFGGGWQFVRAADATCCKLIAKRGEIKSIQTSGECLGIKIWVDSDLNIDQVYL